MADEGLDRVIAYLDDLSHRFDEELKEISQVAAMDAIALIVRRIHDEGIGKTYSNKKVPAYLILLDESRLDTQKTKDFVRSVAARENPADRYTNWYEIRVAHGNGTSRDVNLTFTGEMFRQTGIIDVSKQGDYWVTTIGGLNKEVQDKMRWNAQRYGDFFVLTPEEYELIQSIIDGRIEKFFNIQQ